ncbi:MAG: IS1380 family transposase, partial [Bacteroidaceae bacterium]|nr:IS1380 family transposase [Bacteroidaceae bacterium]
DTVLRGIEELATENISYTVEKTGNVYDFNTAEKLNQLLIKLLLATGQLTEGGEYDVDFDHQFLEAEKYDSKRTYKGFDGYSPGVFTIGGLIAYLENRDGNANVRFKQAETHRRFSESAKSVEDKEDYSVDLIKRRRILFKPSKKLMQEIRKVKKTIVVDEVEEP